MSLTYFFLMICCLFIELAKILAERNETMLEIATQYCNCQRKTPLPLKNVVSDVALVRKCICIILVTSGPNFEFVLGGGEFFWGGSSSPYKVVDSLDCSSMIEIMLKSRLCLKTFR